MENKDRKICFALDAVAMSLILIIVCLNYQFMMYIMKTVKTYHGIYYGREPLFPLQFAYFLSIFLCSFLFQGSEVFTMIRLRKSLLIRWELIILSMIAFLLSLIKIWLPLLFPEHNYGTFTVLVYSILLNPLWDVVFMFAAGIFFFRAFHVRESLMEKRDRIIGFILNVAAIFLIVVIIYCNYKLKRYLIETSDINKALRGIGYASSHSYYLQYFANLISAFVCSLLLLGENIYMSIHQRKALIIRKELLILGIVAIMLALMKIWFILIWHNLILPPGFDIFLKEMNKIISLNELWNNILMFVAGILFVRAFHTITTEDAHTVEWA